MPKLTEILDFHLNDNELISLSIVLWQELESHGIKIIGSEYTSDSYRDFHPDSHLGTLVSLYRRVRRVRMGHKQYNAREQTRSDKAQV